jgi:hypothetical protein
MKYKLQSSNEGLEEEKFTGGLWVQSKKSFQKVLLDIES